MGAWGDNGAMRTLLHHYSLYCISLHPPPSSHIDIWLKVAHHTHTPTHTQTPLFQLLSDGWRGRVLTLALWGLLCHSPLAV